jgi:hypothetical protein
MELYWREERALDSPQPYLIHAAPKLCKECVHDELLPSLISVRLRGWIRVGTQMINVCVEGVNKGYSNQCS